MDIRIAETKLELGQIAAHNGADFIRKSIEERGEAVIVVATGASQFEMLEALVKNDIEWEKVTGFHLDEYIGISESHPASFCNYLRQRFVEKVTLKKFHYINGKTDPQKECGRLAKLITSCAVDVAFIGIGENGHLAFNDPPADFTTQEPYIVVNLDKACREQQLGEGWFESLADVPETAISMSVQQILQARTIICTVPDARKAKAVGKTVKGPVTPLVPASVLQQHKRSLLFLDRDSAKHI